MASTTAARPAAVRLSLELPHVQCPRCKVWSRRPDRCPNCGAAKVKGAELKHHGS